MKLMRFNGKGEPRKSLRKATMNKETPRIKIGREQQKIKPQKFPPLIEQIFRRAETWKESVLCQGWRTASQAEDSPAPEGKRPVDS